MLKRSKVDMDYNPEGDVLDIFAGKPYTTDNFELDSSFTLRLNPKNQKLVGLIIYNFSKLFPEGNSPHDRHLLAGILLRLFQKLHGEEKLREPLTA